MPESIPNLWPPDIRVDVVAPITILKAQAENLSQNTRGFLRNYPKTGSLQSLQSRRYQYVAQAS